MSLLRLGFRPWVSRADGDEEQEADQGTFEPQLHLGHLGVDDQVDQGRLGDLQGGREGRQPVSASFPWQISLKMAMDVES